MLEHIVILGTPISAYSFFNVLAFILLLTFNLLQRGKPFISNGSSDPSEKKAVTRNIWMILILSLVQFLSGAGLNILVGKIFNGGSYNYFGFAIFAPFVFAGFCRLIKADPIGYLDAFTPAYALSLVSFKTGCFCAGCCKGADIGPTLYYPVVRQYQFPVQIVECVVAAIIFVLLLYYRERAHRGTMHAMYLILYSSTRFFSEFLRAERNLFLCFKAYHIWCLVGIIAGVIEFRVLKRRCLSSNVHE